VQHPKATLLGDLFGLKQSLSTKSRDGFVRFDPPKLCVPVSLSIDAFFAFHNVKKVARFRYWLIAFYDVNDLAARHVHPCAFGEEARFGISRMRQPAEGTRLLNRCIQRS
jgi:hypothetical protein